MDLKITGICKDHDVLHDLTLLHYFMPVGSRVDLVRQGGCETCAWFCKEATGYDRMYRYKRPVTPMFVNGACSIIRVSAKSVDPCSVRKRMSSGGSLLSSVGVYTTYDDHVCPKYRRAVATYSE